MVINSDGYVIINNSLAVKGGITWLVYEFQIELT